MKNNLILIPFVLLTAIQLLHSNPGRAQRPDLGSSGAFVLFTTAGTVSNIGFSQVSGKIGSGNSAITGFAPMPGQQESTNSVTQQASTDLASAYSILSGKVPTYPPHVSSLGNGEILTAGVYVIQSAGTINGVLTLDAAGDANAIFIFQIEGAFSPASASQISLIGGAMACNVFWVVKGGELIIASNSDMRGSFIVGGSGYHECRQLTGRKGAFYGRSCWCRQCNSRLTRMWHISDYTYRV